MTTVFLGGGRITSAILAGLRLAGYREPLVVHDRNSAKLRRLKKLYAVSVERNLADAIADADLIVVAVRPESLDEIFPALQGATTAKRRKSKGTIAVSLAAGLPLETLRSSAAGKFLWARAMPSPASRTGHGLTAVAFDRTMSRSARADIRSLFEKLGPVLEIPERQFDAFTVNYSSSHGYHALATLTDAAVANGLDRKIALLASAHALADGIMAWRAGNISLSRLLREAATPGGVAETTMTAMNQRGYQRAVEAGFRAGLARTRANAKLRGAR